MNKLKAGIILLAAMPIMVLTGCKKDAQQDAAKVNFNLTDAPGEFDALNIDVQGVMVHTQASGWVTIHSNMGVINILDYVNGQTTLIASADLPEGSIDQIQLMLGTNNTVEVNGNTYSVTMPSQLQGGLTLSFNHQLHAGATYNYTIDFDAAQSVNINGTGSYQMQPVIRLIVGANASANGNGGSGSANGGIDIDLSGSGSTVVNAGLTGGIMGTATAGGGLSVVTATNNTTHATVSTMTNLTGHFMIQAVQSGSYTVTIDPILPLFSTHTSSDVNVTAGQTTDLGLVAL